VKNIAAEGCIFETKIIGLSDKTDKPKIVLELLAVFVLASGAANINQHWFGLMYNCV
jgi:hypothetical protein